MHLKSHKIKSHRAVGINKKAIKTFKRAKWKKIQ